MGALLYRAQALHVIDQRSFQNAMKYMSARGWRTEEPGDRELGSAEAPLLLERAVRTYEVETGRTVEDLLLEASLPVDDSLALLSAAADGRPLVEL
jgi:hypothetical protein